MAIDGIGPMQIDWPRGVERADKISGEKPTVEGDFGKALSGALQEVRDAEQTSDAMSRRFAAGDPTVGIHEVMIASEKAAVAMRYAVTMKNKLIEAYRELMNTPI